MKIWSVELVFTFVRHLTQIGEPVFPFHFQFLDIYLSFLSAFFKFGGKG